MKGNALKIALVVSLVFNAAVIGAFAYGVARGPAPGVCGPHPGFPPGEPFAGRTRLFARRIGLPRERAMVFSRAMADTAGGIRELRLRVQRERGELAGLMSAPRVDEKAILAKVDTISALQGQLERRLVSRLIGVSATLRPEERERFMRVIRSRCGACEPGCPEGPPEGRKGK